MCLLQPSSFTSADHWPSLLSVLYCRCSLVAIFPISDNHHYLYTHTFHQNTELTLSLCPGAGAGISAHFSCFYPLQPHFTNPCSRKTSLPYYTSPLSFTDFKHYIHNEHVRTTLSPMICASISHCW